MVTSTITASAVSSDGHPGPRRLPRRVRHAFDVVAVTLLTVLAYLVRRGSLPTDGVWFDDSWVAAGAIMGSPRQLLVVGSGHPAFTGLLMVVDRLGGDLGALGVPSLLAGIAAPPLLYLALRSFGYERALCALLSAALVVAPIHILYSGRIKGYTLDVLWVLALGAAVPLLARRSWRWPLAGAWVVAAVAIGLFSGYTLVATAGAGLVLVLHPASDRVVRLVAVGVQAAVQAVYLKTVQSKTDLAGIEEVMEVAYDGHMTFSANPVTFGGEVLTHLGRVAEVFPAGPDGWLSVLGVVTVIGLVLAAWGRGRRTETVAGRYFAVLVGLAFVGSLLHRFPFGPTNMVVSAGGRHTLWLVPAVAFGLCVVGHRLRTLTARRDGLRFGFDTTCLVLAAVVLVAGYGPAPKAPFAGFGSAAEFVQSAAGPGDVIIVPGASVFSYGITADTPVSVRATPDHQVGFAPVYLDPDVHATGSWAVSPGTSAEIRSWVTDADQVFVIIQGPTPGDLRGLEKVLVAEGFTSERETFEWAAVDEWSR